MTAYLPVTLVPLIITACIALWFWRIEIRDQTFRQLKIITDGVEAQVLDYLNYLKIQTSGYSTSMLIMDAIKKRYRHTGNKDSDWVLNGRLATDIKKFPECVEMLVLDVNGRVIASSDASNTGIDLSQTDYFLNGQKAVYVSDIFREEETGRIMWLVSCPFRNSRDNSLLAVLVCRINPITLSDITTERKIRALEAKTQSLRLGRTSETYIVNRDNLMITESRFLSDVILKQVVDTEIVRCTTKEGETMAVNYQDYRGVPVDGASMVIKETGWIVISEIDIEESIKPFQRLLTICLIGIGALIPLILFTSWLLSRRFTQPTMRLVQADRAMIQGDPSHAFISDHEIAADELGEVMRTRNIMLTSIKETEGEIQREKEKYKNLVENIPDAIYSALPDETGTVTFMSHQWTEWSGYTPEDFYRDPETWMKSVHPEDREYAMGSYREAIKSQQNYDIEYRVMNKNTCKIFCLRDRGIVVRDGKGNIIRCDGIVTDITERKQSEEKLKQRLDELEQFRKVTIQREIRMRELKDRVEELEKEIKKYEDTGGKAL